MAKELDKGVLHDKEALFENYFWTASKVISGFESIFDAEGVWSKVFGVDGGEQHSFGSPAVEQAAKDHVRNSIAWYRLSLLYDYAVDGVDIHGEETGTVINGAEVLSYITTEEDRPAEEWERIVALGDGRYALDDGMPVSVDKLALLANVDVRTVRNAISAGELAAQKQDGSLSIDNASARKWLLGRRGFKPTVYPADRRLELKKISTPAEFGAFLTARRQSIGQGDEKQLTVFHRSVDFKALSEIEAGVFSLPIDTVFPIADFYQIDRKEFLACVMRVFFAEQLSTLRETLLTESAGAK